MNKNQKADAAPVDAVVMQRIQHWLDTWDEPGNEARERFERFREEQERDPYWIEQRRIIEESKRLTEKEFQIVVY